MDSWTFPTLWPVQSHGTDRVRPWRVSLERMVLWWLLIKANHYSHHHGRATGYGRTVWTTQALFESTLEMVDQFPMFNRNNRACWALWLTSEPAMFCLDEYIPCAWKHSPQVTCFCWNHRFWYHVRVQTTIWSGFAWHIVQIIGYPRTPLNWMVSHTIKWFEWVDRPCSVTSI